MSSLAQILHPDPYDLDGGPEKHAFEVTDFGSANWALAKAMDATTEIARLEAQAKEWKQRIDDWLAKQKAEYQRTVEYMEAVLRPFVEAELRGKKRRSLALPSGVAGFRKGEGKLDITDEAATMAWAKANCPEAIKMPEPYLLKDPLKKHIKEKGEIPDGTTFEDGVDRFYVKPGADE